jgi:hypothetical protein
MWHLMDGVAGGLKVGDKNRNDGLGWCDVTRSDWVIGNK